MSLLKLFCKNLNYFINKDGIDVIKRILGNILLIKPPQQGYIQQLVKNQLITQLQGIEDGIDTSLICELVIPGLYHLNSLSGSKDKIS